ncbi:MAG: GntR family transcriptional regulator [Treponema sp. GWB1_62_6]|nr:MAG: GntR family transcriptional regulator [Treponema sp. GWC1_61_84]OHE70457.1 MAG: GntR family transcriptional regulator [Treponema sp. GWB1_62_6]OHE72852.1 MAG: GntR family transcriptional regulator [Treponema sp. RIFOXYC1_FULL_61_9]HCM28198.1 GntR family transcriptional regulator [Treponema sp.]
MAEANLSVDVYDRLSERILKWEYPPGHRLTEEELCSEFAVSRSPVREALGMLAERGLVDKKARQGYTVRRLDLKEIKDLYDLRLILEIAVVEVLCLKGVGEPILDKLASRWKALLEGLPELASNAAGEDEEFHRLLAAECGNGALARTLADIDARIHFVRISDITNTERLKITCADHLEIIEALKRRDREKAVASLRRNIEWGKTNVEAAIRDALVRAHLAL